MVYEIRQNGHKHKPKNTWIQVNLQKTTTMKSTHFFDQHMKRWKLQYATTANSQLNVTQNDAMKMKWKVSQIIRLMITFTQLL